LVGLALLATACSGQGDEADEGGQAQPEPTAVAPQVLQAGAPGEQPRPLTAEDVDDLATPAHTAGDVAFVRDMLHHHAQALEMTALAESNAGSDRIRLIAQRMDISQESEIDAMLAWLQARGEDPPEHHAGMDHAMPGILTPAQMDDLAAAEGTEFDRLFLESMTYHHNGALEMVTDLYARDDGSGDDIDIFQLASHIDADQRIEIDRMAELHDELVDGN
jgi:uncharacterized protein (DUF305 family)